MGSNLGDREENLRSAIEKLSPEIRVDRVSSIYETEPVGVAEQPEFLNLALSGETDLPPTDLLDHLKRTEREVGRVPSHRWGPRAIDIDILLYGDAEFEEQDLIIPHREMAQRAFVLVPLAEIAPHAIHPAKRVTISELASRVEGKDSVRKSVRSP
jgi:2-amino-4-hydroxy-6-hydroxymethyldihydropteridine diphosphokinase